MARLAATKQLHKMPIKALLIDIDQTLYDRSVGLPEHQRERCRAFFRERLGCTDPQQAKKYASLDLEGVRQVVYPALDAFRGAWEHGS